ncbi:hypothetical protein NUW58_g6758 [Xylaria curta]|uniref:Uncharacterized protein n=1 Tax=Xylaria curta TaxID=42375 RepID=A0ACC1NQ07_9PEZI|nr:hypothetical protein NUW58_g6758 [Xylaria curta]
MQENSPPGPPSRPRASVPTSSTTTPLIDERVASEWNVPAHWQLTAQLVFGGRAGEPGPKDHLPLEETFKVAGV